MKFLESPKYQWIGPALVLISGIVNLMNPDLDKELVYIWYVLTSFAGILTAAGLYRLYKPREKEK
ncbi:hypothetical protein [Fulvivirga sedimenti]|uniref:Uncharacterized protein n=1 Tax=Fulvivirga sedimenti TaxID=2879465 RepID=A0A9X1HQ31_9BACT|nr:hypothetical protein [Fulvivirga sedimenti]MCA6075051.1 hypothetical protein [Fulvivirga sedimenti]MCA6076228.1 hypothetical protein [Fulvivirga sedimenti]MCA6077356.1 hypothetical protein [Fulvivirga sedimenti]